MPAISPNKPYRIARSRTGLGLFATKAIRKGSKIIRYFGPILDSRKKKVGSAPYPDEWRRALDMEVGWPALDRDASSLSKVADRIRSRIEGFEAWVVEPGVLNHFELPRDVSIKGNE